MHLQRQGDEHAGSGSGGASSLKKRLYCSPPVASHDPSSPTTLTACHGCLKRRGSLLFVHHLRKLVCHSLVRPPITVGLIKLGKFLSPLFRNRPCRIPAAIIGSLTRTTVGGSRTCCEPHHHFTRFVPECCNRRSISEQIAEVQPLTTNISVQRLGNVRNIDTFAARCHGRFVADNL
jgi:hypothetical protein